MAQEAIQLLNLSQQATQQALGRIDQAMTRTAGFELEKSKAIADMSVKQTLFAEEQRMNDFRIQEASHMNDMRAKEFALREQQFAYDKQIGNLKFQEAQIRLDQAKKSEALNHFNGITSFTDANVASHLAKTQNPEHARAYLKYKADAMSSALSGDQFDPVAYNEGANKLMQDFSKDTPYKSKGYSHDDSYLFGQIHPNLQRRYEEQNPIYQQTKSQVAMQYIQGTESQVGSILEKHGQLIDSVLPQLAILRDTKNINEARMRDAYDQAARFDAAVWSAKDEATKTKYEKQRDYYLNEAERLQQENNNIFLNIQKGIYDITAKNEPTEKAPEWNVPRAMEAASESEGSFRTPASKSLENSSFSHAIGNIQSIVGIPKGEGKATKMDLDGTEFDSINMNWFMDNAYARGNVPDSATLLTIKNKILNRTDAIYGDNEDGALDDRMDLVGRKLIETIKIPTAAPVSVSVANAIFDSAKDKDYLREDSNGQPFVYFGSRVPGWTERKLNNLTEPFVDTNPIQAVQELFGQRTTHQKKLVVESINSLDDIKKIVKNIKDPTVREQAKKELHAALGAASISYAIQQDK